MIKHFKDGILIQTEPDKPEEIEEKAERLIISNAINAIDNISNLADAKLFLKQLCKWLKRKGIV